jgi:hypothetical protein
VVLHVPDCSTAELHTVNRWSRVALGFLALFCVWQIVWLFKVRPNVEEAIPDFQGVDLWIWLWGVVGLTCGVAVIVGRDTFARFGFGSMAVVSAMGAATTLSSASGTAVIGCAMTGQFYAFGQAVLLSALSFDMLLSPLRVMPAPVGLEPLDGRF